MFRPRPLGITLLSLFFVFGATMSGLAAGMLLFPGSFLEPLWRLNPQARQGFARLGPPAVLIMVMVCASCGATAVGLWRLARWGYRCAIAILAINLTADTINAFALHDRRTLIGLPIGGALIAYLVARRRSFANNEPGV